MNNYGADIYKLMRAYGQYIRDATLDWVAANAVTTTMNANQERWHKATGANVIGIDRESILAGKKSPDLDLSK